MKRSAEILGSARSALVWVFLLPLRFYSRVISPALPARCRYYPTCSAYAEQAVRTHGIVKGTGLAAWRVVRCNPFSAGGVDEVPPRRPSRRERHRHTHGAHA